MADLAQQITAAGFLSAPLRLLVENIARSNAFQNRCGFASYDGISAEAIARVAHPHLANVDSLDDVRGCWAVVWTEDFQMIRVSNFGLRPFGTLSILFRDDDRYPDRSDLSQIDFQNFLGAVLSDLAQLPAASPDFILPIQTIRMVGSPRLSHPKAAGQGPGYWVAVLDVVLGRV